MKPPARIERECWIVSQLFEGYDGYVYEAVNRRSLAVCFHFVIRGNRLPDGDHALERMLDEHTFETVLNLKDGIHRLKNHVRIMAERERRLLMAEKFKPKEREDK